MALNSADMILNLDKCLFAHQVKFLGTLLMKMEVALILEILKRC